jgi:hypothetical protein
MRVDGHTRCTLLLILIALLCLVLPGWAGDTQKKEGSAKVLRRVEKIVEAGELAGRELAHDASEAGRDAWEKAKEVSAAAAEEVRRATHEFWRDLMEEKARLRAKLRRANAELRARRAT